MGGWFLGRTRKVYSNISSSTPKLYLHVTNRATSVRCSKCLKAVKLEKSSGWAGKLFQHRTTLRANSISVHLSVTEASAWKPNTTVNNTRLPSPMYKVLLPVFAKASLQPHILLHFETIVAEMRQRLKTDDTFALWHAVGHFGFHRRWIFKVPQSPGPIHAPTCPFEDKRPWKLKVTEVRSYVTFWFTWESFIIFYTPR